MFYILIFGATMAVASAVFWCLEAMGFVRAVRALEKPDSKKNPLTVTAQSVRYIAGFVAGAFLLWPLAIDITCTIWLVGAFGFTGMIGGVIGLTISNVISIFLILISRRRND